LIRFISPEGQITDSLSRRSAVSPTISLAGQNLFLAYNRSGLNEEIMLWLTDSGTILREDTVAVGNVEFSYVDNMKGNLVTFTSDPWL